MNRRGYLSAAVALLTTGSAGCLRLSAEETATETPTGGTEVTPTATPGDAESPTGTRTDTGTPVETETPAETETPTETEPVNGTQFVYDGDAITLDNAPGQEIRGRTDLEPGTDIEILLKSETTSDPFVKLPEATVQDDGRFSATVDLSNNDEGTEFTAEATHDDETLATADGHIV